jgi:L-ascorbate metabolism protein UlaG (beta-lactamase superfamily)
VAGRVTWLGHSTVAIELGGSRIATDPVLRRGVLHLRRHGAVPPETLLPLDAVLLSHLHHDHLDLPTLAALGRDTRILVPRGGGRMLRRRGFRAVEEVVSGRELDVGAAHITVTEAEHDARRFKAGPAVPAVGYVLEADLRVYFAGDTDFFPGMEELAGADLVLLPISGWGRQVGRGHLDPARAAHALGVLRPRAVVPIHWGTYRMLGHRGRLHDIDTFRAGAAEAAPDVAVHVLPIGGSLELEL